VLTVKQLIIAGVLLLALAMAFTPTSSAYDDTQRAVAVVAGGNVQYSYHIAGALKYNSNVTLPFPIGDFDHTLTKICLHFTGACSLTSGHWNNRAFGAHSYTTGQWANETITIAISNGFDVARTYSNINYTMNNTHWEAYVYYYLSNVADINSLITYTETDNADPKVDSFWPVTDTLTFGTLPFDLTCRLKLDYPDAVGTPDLYPWNGTTVSSTDDLTVDYQKYGPGHDFSKSDVVQTITGDKHEVTLTIKSDDKLEDASWNIYPVDDAWDGKLDTMTAATLAIDINGHTLDSTDWELTESALKIDNVVGIHANDDNELYLSWTTGGGGGGTVTPTEAEPWYAPLNAEPVAGIPMWAIVAVIAVIAIAGIAIWKQEK
jgi:hypothetical protein